RVAVEADAEGDEEVLPGQAAGEDALDPAAGGGDAVVGAHVGGRLGHGEAVRGEVDVPDAAVGAGDLEPDDHCDLAEEVVAEAAEVLEVGGEPLVEAGAGFGVLGDHLGDGGCAVGGVAFEVIGGVGEGEPGGDRVADALAGV